MTAVVGSRLIDGTGADPVDEVVVRFEGQRITAVGRRSEVPIPRGARYIDVSGLTLLPAFIDTHVHLLYTGRTLDLNESLAVPRSLSLLRTVASMRATLDAGFTTVRDGGGTPAGVRRAVDEGVVAGPRMQLAVTALSPTGGHTDTFMPSGVHLAVPSAEAPSAVVDGVEPMRHRVRELVRAGADWVKLCTSGGVISAGDSLSRAAFTVEEIAAAVVEAAAHGRRVMAHAHAAAGIRNALDAGVATIEHGVWLDDAALEAMVETESYFVPTLSASAWVLRHVEEGRAPSWTADKVRQVAPEHRRSAARAIEAGVKVAFGTDAGVGPHGCNGEEFPRLVEAGMTPMAAIRAATAVAAELLGWSHSLGTLEEGKLPDLVAVDGDPLDDISVLASPERVRLVVKAGSVLKHELS